MASVEVLGRLCAGAVDFSRVGAGGQSDLQRLEVAGFLAGLSRGPMLLALAKYMQDAEALRKLVIEHQAWLVNLAMADGWLVDGVADRMAGLSVSEVVDDKCPRCHGTRFIRAKACTSCDGTGFRRVSGRSIAGWLGVSETSYRRVWSGRYQQAVERLRGFDVDINRAVSRSVWSDVLKNA